MKQQLEAIYNAIIVKPTETDETSYGSIIIPDVGKEKNKTAEVVAVGPGHYSATGVLIPTVLKPGDIIILPSMGFSTFEFEGEEYWVGPENQCMGKINKIKK